MTPSPLEKFVLDARDKAITASDATYLAACDTSTLTWYAGPNDSAYLVAKEDVRTAEEALPNHLADPGNHPAPSAPEPVVLSMIARIPTDSFYMTSCGMWRGPKKAAQTFDKTAGTLTAAHPNLADLDQDFNSVLAKLLTLRRLAITHKVYRGVFKSEDDKTRLRLRHVLFENVQNLSQEERAKRRAALSPGDEFTLKHWPTPYYEEARVALKQMQSKGDFIARPLVARDIKGVAIPPDAYRHQLAGCVALVQFTLSRFSFPPKGDEPAHDRFVVDIDHIRVLNPPYGVKHPNDPPSPNKRKATIFTLTENDDSMGSPKKPRIGGVDVASA